MNNLPQVRVFFNNGASVSHPWHVAGTEGNAMATDHGQFSNAETAIIHAAELARISRKPLIVPAWLQALADEIAEDDARFAELRENDSIGYEESRGGF